MYGDLKAAVPPLVRPGKIHYAAKASFRYDFIFQCTKQYSYSNR